MADPCPRCGGDGLSREHPVVVLCPACGGSGERGPRALCDAAGWVAARVVLAGCRALVRVARAMGRAEDVAWLAGRWVTSRVARKRGGNG